MEQKLLDQLDHLLHYLVMMEIMLFKLSSSETRKVSNSCIATIGTVSNPDQKNIKNW